MEDKNSWNEVIFYHINARSEWLSSLIWRNRQKIEGDTTEDKNDDDAGKKKKVNLDPSNKEMIDWFDKRQKNFKKLSEEEIKSFKRTPHGWNEEINNPSETASSRVRSRVEEPTTCKGEEMTKTPHGWSEEINLSLIHI